MQRDQIIATILDNTTLLKRTMYACLQPAADAAGLSPAQLELLTAIQHTQPANTKQLARQLQLTPGAISQLTDVLEHLDYIARTVDPLDRRTHTLKLTAKGARHYASIQQQRAHLFKSIMGDMTDAELDVWQHIQQKILTKLQEKVAVKGEKV
jgi:DNA-binding MarR family transcriptional regulator